MSRRNGSKLVPRVSETTNRSREAGHSCVFAEPTVWSSRMLSALENGVKGGKWYSLMDKVYQRSNLEASVEKVEKRSKRAKVGVSSLKSRFKRKHKVNIDRLEQELREGSYRPRSIQRVWINKPGKKGEKRPLGVPIIRDRAVQTALKNVIEPLFEKRFSDRSFGFRPGRGCKDALREVVRLLRAGHTWVVDADIKSYFDSIPHEKLMTAIEEVIADGSVLELIRRYLKQKILEEMREWTPEEGTPQGAVISPLLANIYLDAFDKYMADRGYELVRYADDFVVLCRSREEAEHALQTMRAWLTEAGLTLHPLKTRLVDETERGGFDFLGYHFERGMKWPRSSSLKKLKAGIRKYTKRTSGWCMTSIIAKLNQILRGWFEYFKHSIRTIFPRLDSWIRMRLRSILRKRMKKKGRGRGSDHQRWPNAYFSKLGLFSLTAAQARA